MEFNSIHEKPEADLPLVTVVIPAYNAEKTISATLDALAQQIYPRVEVVVVDNGSDDETQRVVQRYHVILLSENAMKSPYYARAKGISHAQGSIIAFTDANCLPSHSWIEEGIKKMHAAQADVVGGKIDCKVCPASSAAEVTTALTDFDHETSIHFRGVAWMCNLFVRKEVFDRIPLPLETRSGGDTLFTVLANAKGKKLVYTPNAVVQHPTLTFFPLMKRSWRIGRGKGAHVRLLPRRATTATSTMNVFSRPQIRALSPFYLIHRMAIANLDPRPFLILRVYVCIACVLLCNFGGALQGVITKRG